MEAGKAWEWVGSYESTRMRQFLFTNAPIHIEKPVPIVVWS